MTQKNGIVQLRIQIGDGIGTAAKSNNSNSEGNQASNYIITYKAPTEIDRSSGDHALEAKLKEGINKVRNAEYERLSIESNGYLEMFKDDIFLNYLKLLEQAKIEFDIEGIEQLNVNNIGLFVELLEQKYRQRKSYLHTLRGKKTTPRKKNKAGIAALISKGNIDHNRWKKKQIADLDPNNITARKEIANLKKNKTTDYKIAKELNNKEILTSKGSQFQPNTVKRQYHAFELLKKAFKRNNLFEKDYRNATVHLNASIVKKPQINEIPLVYTYEQPIDDELILEFDDPIESPLELEIYNNNGEMVFSLSLERSTSKKVLNILNETPLGPGRYYGKLKNPSEDSPGFYKEKLIIFVVREDVIMV